MRFFVEEFSLSDEKTNWSALAGARFLLSLIVLFSHLAMLSRSFVTDFFEQYNAFAAVVAFFLISGYSIRHSILRESSCYFQRRFWRIYPIYLFSLLLAIVLYFYSRPLIEIDPWFLRSVSNQSLLSHLVFGQSFWTQSMPNFSPSWSLGVEVLLYALAPWFLRFNNRILMILAVLSASLYLWNPRSVYYHDYPHPIVAASLAWAWLLGWIAVTEKSRLFRIMLFGLPVLCLWAHVESLGYLGFITTGATALLLIQSHKISLSLRAKSIISFLGDCSYPLYLVHWPVLWACWLRGVTSQWVCLSLVAIVTLWLTMADKALKHSAIIRRGV